MRSAAFVTLQLQIGKLRHGHSQRIPYPAKPSFLGLVGRSSYLFEEVSAVWIISAPHRTIGLPHKLWHDMQVPNGLEEGGHLAEFPVDIHLFEVRLCESLLVLPIFLVGAIEDYGPFMEDAFTPDNWALEIVLVESQLILPLGGVGVCSHSDFENQLGVSARGERAKPGNAAPGVDGLLESTPDGNNVMEKPEGIQEVRFPGSIRPDKKDSLLQIHGCPTEITPILHMQMGDPQCPPARSLHAGPQSRKRPVKRISRRAPLRQANIV
jgi:hypothetical protein